MDDEPPANGVTLAGLAAVARRHGLPVPATLPTPWRGATSHVYSLGDVVVKVAHDREDAARAVVIDARMSQVARRLGVAAPRLLALDATRELLPAPYAIFARVVGAVPVDRWTGSPGAVTLAWQAVGRELARVHRVAEGTAMPLALRSFRQTPEVDPRPWVDHLRARAVLDEDDAGWLRHLLGNLAPAALAGLPPRLCHGDVNAANVLVDARTGAYRALIDWAGAGWLDPAWDAAGIPLAAVPPLLEGHRAVAALPDDATAEARILWCQAQTRLHAARGVSDARIARVQLARDIAQIRSFAAGAGISRR